MMRSALLVAVLAAIAAFCLDGPSAAAQSNQRTVVKIGGSGRADQARFELALRRGYFAEADLDVQIVTGGVTAQDYLSSIATNQIQVSGGSPNAAMMNALNRGIDIRIVADFARIANGPDSTLSLIVRQDLLDAGAIKTVADLKGRNVSLGPSVGSVNEMFFDKALALGKLKRPDLDVTTLGFAEALAALGNRKLDAAVVIEPLVWTAERQKIAKSVVNAGEVDPGAQVSVLYYSPEFARNVDAATRFMVAYLRGIRELSDALVHKKNIDSVVDVLVENLPIKDRRLWTDAPPQRIDLNGRVNVDHIKAQAEFYKSTGSITGPIPDIDKIVDMKFADAAVKQLGRRD